MLRIASYNVRYDNKDDQKNKYGWAERRPLVVKTLRLIQADVFGLQEPLHYQVQDIASDLVDAHGSPIYSWVGGGRDDGGVYGEFSPIFYKTARFRCIESGTRWLSPEPHRPGSKGWDACLQRIATFAVLQDKDNSDKVFIHVNTHFDHIGAEARRQSAGVVLSLLDELAGRQCGGALPSAVPLFLTGDFNDGPESSFYEILTRKGLSVTRGNQSQVLKLTETSRTAKHGTFGPRNTFTGFVKNPHGEILIDFVFATPCVSVQQHYSVPHDLSQAILASDHLPVVADVVF